MLTPRVADGLVHNLATVEGGDVLLGQHNTLHTRHSMWCQGLTLLLLTPTTIGDVLISSGWAMPG